MLSSTEEFTTSLSVRTIVIIDINLFFSISLRNQLDTVRGLVELFILINEENMYAKEEKQY